MNSLSLTRLVLPVVLFVVVAMAVAGLYYAAFRPAEADLQEVRWGNTVLRLSHDSSVSVIRDFAPAEIAPPDGGQVLVLIRGGSRVVIDAETGAQLQDRSTDTDRPSIERVLETLSISPARSVDGAWPYGSVPPGTPRQRLGNITYIAPDPASGLTILEEAADDPGGSGYAIRITNGRSALSMDAVRGQIFQETTTILPEDQAAFDRFVSAIQFDPP